MTPIVAKGDGPRAVRPFGNDPEELGGADHDECAPRIDQRGKPVGYAEAAEAAVARNRPARIGDEQRQPVERVRDGGQYFRRLIGQQPQRRRARREGDQPPHRYVTSPQQAGRVSHPTRRLVLLRLQA